MAELDKTFDPHAIEARWYPVWEQRGYFAPDMQAEGEPFSVMLPPPNVTGRLHMGHALDDTLQDALTRYHRMKGVPTLWQPGTDHAGIATQMLVERQVEAEGSSRHAMGREAFVDRIWQWKAESGGHITTQMRRLGASVDWSRERFTMDDGLSAAVQRVFIELYEKGLIYRGQRLVNWDPVLKTAISDLEVESVETAGHMWHFKYPLEGGATYEYVEHDADGNETFRETRDYISIATTRPETMLGDGAIAVHPSDTRYAPIVGQKCEIPVGPKAQRRLIPIITDEYPDPEFGSGAVKITGAHDFNDYEVAKRNGLPMYRLMDDAAALRTDGTDYASAAARAAELLAGEAADATAIDAINLVPKAYRGLNRFEARERIVADVEANGLLIVIEDKAIMQPFGDRSGQVIEPMLTNQWFVDTKTLAEPAIKAVEDGRIRFIPDNWSKTYFEWMRNIQDWCISRQLWWGHRIPAWYDTAGNIYVGADEAAIRAQHGLGAEVTLTQDEDVLDTWFSSGLWPFSTLGWPEDTEALKTFYPTSVLVTGFDIIFFWVARMIMMGMEFMGDVPFRDVYIHGLVRDSDGAKMSKSKGNVLDPIDLIDGIDLESLVAKRTSGMMQPQKAARVEKATRAEFPNGISAFGTDALRFTFAALASYGRDIRFDLGRVEGYRNFCNKLWNAARFALMQVPDDFVPAADNAVELSAADRWIISRLQRVEADMAAHFETYRFDLAANAIHDFVWHHFCDWYLELIKPVLAGNSGGADETRRVAGWAFDQILVMLHPFMPFVTEELWHAMGDRGDHPLITARWCDPEASVDEEAKREVEWLIALVRELRGAKSELGIPPGTRMTAYAADADERLRALVERQQPTIDRLARLDAVRFEAPLEGAAVQILVDGTTFALPLEGVIDLDAERARLAKAHDAAIKERDSLAKRLDNPQFVEKAKPEAVEKARADHAEKAGEAERLEAALARLS